MPSPFPGMDPYLESAANWSGLHFLIISATTEILQPQLRTRGYYATPGERVWLAEPCRPIYPDVATFRVAKRRGATDTAAAVLEVDEPVRIQRLEMEIHEPFVEICDAAGNRLITGIEFLSPTNKSDSEGRELYLKKQKETCECGVNLVEIDLQRAGQHTLDVPLKLLDRFRPWSYLVNIIRTNHPDYEVYPIRLRDRLPRIRIPLKEGDEDAVLDLQAVLDKAYDVGPYPERIDYSGPCSPALSEEDATWADEILKKAGLRKSDG